MIVNYTQQGWSIILQRSHGLLAAQICAHWRKTDQPARWVETLIATAEHDDGRDELAFPELNAATGGPRNFKMKEFERGQCDRLLEMAFAKGRFVGLLTARHIRFLYSNEAAAKSYCRSLKRKELMWCKQAQTTDKEIAASYELLEFCDAFSLIICQGLMQPEGRTMEISSGPGGTKYQLSMSDEQTLKVTPWPFEVKSFQVSYESRCVAQLSFKNVGEFKEKLLNADVKLHKLHIAS
ncbi:Protein of unknown function [Dyadobacter sp. SG02]|uniref:DUF3891 family protein n=1 Tax=Dyadobacter sp. SG02 TaxID=1855291 RepID=UPI0008AF25EF|nr:DUF3891 family protein [Dyadobacter sp. SG02]SEJ38818.1 Protein of unknown function [Dyadobacter sp. SG02]